MDNKHTAAAGMITLFRLLNMSCQTQVLPSLCRVLALITQHVQTS